MNPRFRLRFAFAIAFAGVCACTTIAQDCPAKVDRGDVKLNITERGVIEAVKYSDVVCQVKRHKHNQVGH